MRKRGENEIRHEYERHRNSAHMGKSRFDEFPLEPARTHRKRVLVTFDLQIVLYEDFTDRR
jgi:hypothetical protein